MPSVVPASAPLPTLRWDVFCRVVDNLGDVGVCWRLAQALASAKQQVSLWCDDTPTLQWMAPAGHPRVTVRAWPSASQAMDAELGDVVIEAFGCALGPTIEAALPRPAHQAPRLWVNLEHLTAETFAARNHTLPSPVWSGPASGLVKTFFYPGFTPQTGGVLHRPATPPPAHEPPPPVQPYALLFCYEPQALAHWLDWAHQHQLTVFAAGARTQAACAATGHTHWRALPRLSQAGFDQWLRASCINWVRGEDSLVGALFAGHPMLWQAYAQHDDAHHAKVNALLDWLQAPPSLRHAWHVANHMATAQAHWLPTPGDATWAAWQACLAAASARLQRQPPLHQQLLAWAASRLA